MTTNNDNLGAVSALRGYRNQFLYTLLRVFHHTTKEGVFRPEGEYEDLDIYDSSNKLTEIIQVKDYNGTLTLYNILSSKESTLIRRAIKAYKQGLQPIIKLISFGEVNDQIKNLAQASYSEKTKNILKKKHKLKAHEITFLEENFEYEVVDEEKLKEDVLAAIKEWDTFTDSQMTLDLLLYWTYLVAENQTTITPADFKEQFYKICKFGNERSAFYHSYQTLIKPFDKNLEIENQTLLQANFYQGIAAKYEHILADVDVVREDKLVLLKEKFRKTNIVFIHGASGQGKSTLAYRYLHNCCCDEAVFELKHTPGNIVEVYQMIEALEGISKGINFPVTLYIDVEPGNKEWINILTELATKKHFNFLVTIREEDWNSIEVTDQFEFGDVGLTLVENEAELIYDSLSAHQTDLKFIDFNDAWTTFGGEGPLLEFVYLITQHQSLSAKLKSQINNIRKEANELSKEKIKLLRYISLADAYGAKVKFKDLAQSLNLSDIVFLVEQLQNEYLIKFTESKSHLIGLHPIRSTIIKDLLFDDEINVEAEYALQAIPFIDDGSLLIFLRNAFTQGKLEATTLLDWLKSFSPASWQAYYLILKSLLWKGVYDYVQENIPVLEQIYNRHKGGWLLIIDFDLANVSKDASGVLERFGLAKDEDAKKLSDKSKVLQYAIEWLKNIPQIRFKPSSKAEWEALSMVIFWCIHFDNSSIKVDFGQFDYVNLASQPLWLQSQVLYALKSFNTESRLQVEKVEEAFLDKLSIEHQVISINKTDDTISCHNIFDITQDAESNEEGDDIINNKLMGIIRLLRFAFPEKEHYKVQGVGHKFSFIPELYDFSKKEITQTNLHLKPLVDINSTFINLFEHLKRPLSWQEYANQLLHWREKYTYALEKILNVLVAIHKHRNHNPLIEFVTGDQLPNSLTIHRPKLPQNISDKWGDLGESGPKDSEKSSVATKQYQTLHKKLSKYASSIQVFMNNFSNSIGNRLAEIKGKEEDSKIWLLEHLLEASEALNDFQQLFDMHFSKFVGRRDLTNIERLENECITAIHYLYRHFLYNRGFITEKNVRKYAARQINETGNKLKKKIRDALTKLSKETDNQLRVDFDEENKNCLIIYNVKQVSSVFVALENIYNKLFEAMGQPAYDSIKYSYVKLKLSKFIIVPLVLGKSLQGQCLNITSNTIREKPIHEIGVLELNAQEIPHEIISKYEISSWKQKLSAFNNLDKLQLNVQLAQTYVYHLHQLFASSIDINEGVQGDLFMDYVNKISQLIQQNIQEGLDLYSHYERLCLDQKIIFDHITEQSEFYEVLIKNHQNFYPNDELFKESSFHAKLNSKQIEEWLPRLQELSEEMTTIYYFLAGKIIDGKLLLPDNETKKLNFEA